ncbi:Protein of unknown function [Pyronema omphalodes CBS 100304]|uniref:Uncharacterized protein n=1 Tax=Pyronema omphalodes (strain CBS 100304) TaxID=1076935 RepID=U4L5E4_PYROM|nr:Protein of unknown function [Pyronema omphalodes CBS 100304]
MVTSSPHCCYIPSTPYVFPRFIAPTGVHWSPQILSGWFNAYSACTGSLFRRRTR